MIFKTLLDQFIPNLDKFSLVPLDCGQLFRDANYYLLKYSDQKFVVLEVDYLDDIQVFQNELEKKLHKKVVPLSQKSVTKNSISYIIFEVSQEK